jgi:lysozyme
MDTAQTTPTPQNKEGFGHVHPFDMPRTMAFIGSEEGFKPTVYRCTEHKRTIGKGYNLDARGNPPWWNGVTPWTVQQADAQLHADILAICQVLDRRYPHWREHTPARQAVMVSAVYQLGIAGAAKFVRTIAAIHVHDYPRAVQCMNESLWDKQTPERADRAEQIMLTGLWLEGAP